MTQAFEMSVERNKQLIAQLFEFMNARDYDAAFTLFAEDALIWVAGDPESLPGAGSKTPQAFKEMLQQLAKLSSSGLKTTLINSIGEGDRVAMEAEAIGKLDDGTTYFNQYHFVFEVRDNKIVLMKEYFDTLRAYDYAKSWQAQ